MEEDFALIALKTGFFFAKCDGEFSSIEISLLNQFYKLAKINGNIARSFIEKAKQAAIEAHTIDGIIWETKRFLSKQTAEDSLKYRQQLYDFVKSVIEADNVRRPAESANFNAWIAHLGLSEE